MVEFELPEKYTRASVIAFVQSCNNLISIYSGLSRMVELVDVELDIIQTELDIDLFTTSPESYQADESKSKLLSAQNRLAELCAKRTRIQTRELIAARDLAYELQVQTDRIALKQLDEKEYEEFCTQREDTFLGTLLTAHIANKAKQKLTPGLAMLVSKANDIFDTKMKFLPSESSDPDSPSKVPVIWCAVDPAEVLEGINYAI